jgi:hypothetical protein
MSEPDELEKIAQLAVTRGYWDARAAENGVKQARLHTTGPQKLFLRKLLERTCGLTYDELSRLEKDALAPPVSQTPGKPLPRLGSAKPASAVHETMASSEVVIPRAPEKKDAPAPPAAETYVAPPREEQIITSSKKLPRLGGEPRKETPAGSQSGGEIVTPRPLPRLGTPKKKPEEEQPPSS